MNNPKIDQILSHAKEDPCITIIFPTHRISPERRKDALLFSNLIEETNTNATINKYKYKHNNLFAFICVNIIGVIMLPFVYYYVIY